MTKLCKVLDMVIELAWVLFYVWLFAYGVCTYIGAT